MKFTINCLLLFQAVKAASAAVRPNKSLPALNCLLFQADSTAGEVKVTGTNLQTQVQKIVRGVNIERGGSGVILSKVIYDILQRAGNQTVSIEMVGTEMVILFGRTRYAIPTYPERDYPLIQYSFPNDTIHINKLDSLIRRTGYATTIREDTPMSRCIKMYLKNETSKAYATDGRRMVAAEADSVSDGEFEAVIPEDALRTLCSLTTAKEEFFMGKAGVYAVIFNADTIFVTRLMSGAFFDIENLLAQVEPVHSAILDSKQFYSALSSVAACLQPYDCQCVNLVLKENYLVMSVLTYAGISHSKVVAEYDVNTSNEGYNYQPDLILDFLRTATGPIHLFIDKSGLLILMANQTKYAVVPRRAATAVAPPEHASAKSKKTKAKTMSHAA